MKHPTRSQVRFCLDPYRNTLHIIKNGYVDYIGECAVVENEDGEYVDVIDQLHTLLDLMMVLGVDIDHSPILIINKKLNSDLLLSQSEIDNAFTFLNQCETLLLKVKMSKIVSENIKLLI